LEAVILLVAGEAVADALRISEDMGPSPLRRRSAIGGNAESRRQARRHGRRDSNAGADIFD